MENFNEIQKELVEFSERIHEVGIRHTGLSGTICENLLIKALRNSIPELNFDMGIMKFCDYKLVGRDIDKKKDLSSQMDIIIYDGKPIKKIDETAIIHISQVLGVVEVKKWSSPKMFELNSKFIKKILGLKKLLKEKLNHEIPIFFVTFRFHDKMKSENWFSIIKNIPINAYCLFGTFSKSPEDKKYCYPWEELNWNNFEKNDYSNQFQKLVDEINNLRM